MMELSGDFADGIMDILYRNGLQSVIIEGGRQTIQTFIDSGIWDEARVFRGSGTLKNGTKAPTLSGSLYEQYGIESDALLIFRKS